MKKNIYVTTFVLALLSSIPVQAGMSLLNHSVTFDGNSRKEIAKFINNGKDTLQYTVSLVANQMDSLGNISEITDSNIIDYDASSFLRIYPRTILLPPREVQSVALQLIGNREMEAGEYRTHLKFTPVPRSASDQEPSNTPTANSASAQVKIYQAVSIPVTVLNKPLKITGEIADISIKSESDVKKLWVKISRSGNRSLRAKLQLKYLPGDGSITKEYAPVNIVIYRERDWIVNGFNLDDTIKSGVIQATLSIPGENESETILDSKSITLK